jgi:hypothetical protein
MPELIKLYIRQVLVGFGISGVFVALLLVFDVVGLRGLILTTQGGWMALFLLFFFNGLVFAGVQFAIRVMMMAEPGSGTTGGRGLWQWARGPAQPVRIPVEEAKVAGPQRPWST